MRTAIRTLILSLSFLAAAVISDVAVGAVPDFDVSASSMWKATTDQTLGSQWLQGTFNTTEGYAAWFPYPAGGTSTMWACGPDGSLCRNSGGLITGLDGPTQAFFALGFNIESSASPILGTMNIAADDYFELYVNGHFVRDGLLDLIRQPVTVDFAQFLHDGQNVLAVRAMDGHQKNPALDCNSGAYFGGPFTEVITHLGPFCEGNRLNEALDITGRVVVPEPETASLVAFGLVGLGIVMIRGRAIRRRKLHKKRPLDSRASGPKFHANVLAFIVMMFVTSASIAAYHQVDFSAQANWTYSAVDVDPTPPAFVHLPGAPKGETTLGDVPFNMSSNDAGKEAWSAFVAGGGMQNGPTSLTMNVNVFGVTKVYTLINTFFGAPGPSAYASLVFTGSEGATYTYSLVGNVDIRDWAQSGSTNSINGTTTVDVFNATTTCCAGVGRLDMQSIALPSAFSSQTLTSIKLMDEGSASVLQRVILDGVTISAIPEPSSLSVALLGLTVMALTRYLQRIFSR